MSVNSRSGLLVSAAILIAGAMISGSVFWSAKQVVDAVGQIPGPVTQAASIDPPAPAPTADIAKVALDGEPFLGSTSAPVAVAFWFDYQCPYCRQVEANIMPQLISDYVNTGKIKIYFKDFQFLGPDSQTAALASRAVWEVAPDQFYDWHKAVFQKQDQENGGWGTKNDILAVTKTIAGIDAQKVEEFMTTRASSYQQAMDADLAEGNAMGIDGTPGTLVGKTLISGAQPYRVFKAAIDAALGGGR